MNRFNLIGVNDNNYEIIQILKGQSSSGIAAVATETEETPSPAEDVILCLLWKTGKLGGAYYKISNKQLYVLKELYDTAPQFAITRNILRSITVKHLITIGNPCEQYIKLLIDVITNQEDSVESDKMRKLPSNITLLPHEEYSYISCELKIFGLHLPSMTHNETESEKEIYFRSLIDFGSKMSVHALGALIGFLDVNWLKSDITEGSEPLQFFHINQASMKDHVYIDRNTFDGLQVFSKRSHDAGFKHGGNASKREGASIFKLFSQYCVSKQGYQCLRNILLNPVNDLAELNKRLDFVEFAIQPENNGFIDKLRTNIQKFHDIDMILMKIANSRATGNDWNKLHKTIYNILFVHEICSPYRGSSDLLQELDAKVTVGLYSVEASISDTLDLTQLSGKRRPVIKPGVDEKLDQKKLRRQDVGKHLTAAANISVNQLPQFVDECSIVYIPEMGHLLAIKKTEQNSDPYGLDYLGFQFMFEIHEIFHYKSPICKELDKQLGQIHDEILAHENRIIQRISQFVLKYNKDIREPMEVIALIDCLISMAKVAKEKNYIRPKLNTDNIIEIEEGRHALLEMENQNYVSNDYYSGGQHTCVKIITGPNASGKSIYLKQSTLTVYMAHVGSYVPANSANICIIYSIHTRMHTTESASVRLSSFMIDLSQMSQALNNSKANSLIAVDEFGRGTLGQDGSVLLTVALQSFIKRNELCPHIIIATHLHQVKVFLPESPLQSFMRMKYMKDDEDNTVFLFKIEEGVSSSFAFDVAKIYELPSNIIKNAKQWLKASENKTVINLRGVEENENPEFYMDINI